MDEESENDKDNSNDVDSTENGSGGESPSDVFSSLA